MGGAAAGAAAAGWKLRSGLQEMLPILMSIIMGVRRQQQRTARDGFGLRARALVAIPPSFVSCFIVCISRWAARRVLVCMPGPSRRRTARRSAPGA